ncbi:MAG TPA: T9SS type A sorting domain-containing protein [Bacteroidales bacterium]|nr:T9SS type A sorting domain-containing protein [Bacteroidales bacterium]
MKKYLLFILSFFIIHFSFAQEEENSGNSYTKELQQDTTQLNPSDLQKLKLYPNPVSDYLYVDYEIVYVNEAKLVIYNSIGAIVYSKELKEDQKQLKIPVSELKNGLYFCSLQIDSKLLDTQKILVNH